VSKQLDLPPSSTAPLYGLEVQIQSRSSQHCCSNDGIAVIGFAAGPHAAKLTCMGCGAHRGWLSNQTAERIEEIIAKFGRPTEPIVLRR
jgi:hypothetical protein